MRHHPLPPSGPLLATPSTPGPLRSQVTHVAPDMIEAAQLRRLASTVLCKSPEDLAALAETNPMLVWEWIDAFRKERLAAEAEARYWSAAAAALSTVTPQPVRTAAE
ncbi:MAG: hypothetical protein K2Y42_04985 [Hyphomicrobium sp.]|jgi:hypothetical protein|uniref:hypothetical protein n=1 Tax=Hyphomicrobium sp. TaxID=82 RepID=UPI0025BC562F|nr:hypothetical protein [Hyphomicrobium sp.]MBX9862088.1 hypothetical protein [Hyphomicrobium sp.]